MKKIFLIAFLLLSFLMEAQPIKFYKKYGGPGIEVGYSVKQTLSNGYIVAGSTTSGIWGNTDFILLKLDSVGGVIWQRTYGGYNNDVGRSVIQLADSGYVVTGFTNSFGNGGYDILTIRTDKDGNTIWQRAYGGEDWDFPNEIKQTPDLTSLIICGRTYSFGYGKLDAYVLKLDMSGNLIKQKVFGGAEDDEFKAFTFTYNGLIAFAGTTKSYGDVKGDCWLLKTNLSCDSVFSLKYGDSKKQYLNDIVEAPNHDFVLAGATDINGRDSTWAYLLSLGENGAFKYDNNFPRSEPYKDYQFTCLTNGNFMGNYIYVHQNYDAPAGFKLEPSFYYTLGMWPTVFSTYGSLQNEELYDIARTKDKGYVSVGYTDGFASEQNDIFLVKLDSTIGGSQNVIGINELLAYHESFRVFPTLTKDYVFVETPKHEKEIRLLITNSFGLVIHEEKINETNYSVNLKNYSNGIYFINLKGEGPDKTYKIIKME
jgi:hypothetical protein